MASFKDNYPTLAGALFALGFFATGILLAPPFIYVLRLWWNWWLA